MESTLKNRCFPSKKKGRGGGPIDIKLLADWQMKKTSLKRKDGI